MMDLCCERAFIKARSCRAPISNRVLSSISEHNTGVVAMSGFEKIWSPGANLARDIRPGGEVVWIFRVPRYAEDDPDYLPDVERIIVTLNALVGNYGRIKVSIRGESLSAIKIVDDGAGVIIGLFNPRTLGKSRLTCFYYIPWGGGSVYAVESGYGIYQSLRPYPSKSAVGAAIEGVEAKWGPGRRTLAVVERE